MFATAFLAVSLAAPVPKLKAELYFPVKEGDKRVLVQKSANRTVEITETVTKVEQKDGKHRVTVEREQGGQTTSVGYEVSDQGVFRVQIDGKECEVEPIIKTPVKDGETSEVK